MTKMTVLGNGARVGRLDLGAGQQQEVAVLRLARPDAEDGRRERAVGERVDEPEVAAGHDIPALHADPDFAIAEALDPGVIARAVDRLDRFLALDRDVDDQPLDRLAGEFLRAERIGKLDEIALALAKLRVAHRHLAVGPGRDRKDAGAVEPSAHVFEQGRVALGPDDLFVDPPGFVLGKQPAGQLAAVDHQHEVLDRPLFGKREQEFGLELERPGIVERLRDLDLGDLVAHPAVDRRPRGSRTNG